MYNSEIDKFFCRHCNDPILPGTELHGCSKMQEDLSNLFEFYSEELTGEADKKRKERLRNLNNNE